MASLYSGNPHFQTEYFRDLSWTQSVDSELIFGHLQDSHALLRQLPAGCKQANIRGRIHYAAEEPIHSVRCRGLLSREQSYRDGTRALCLLNEIFKHLLVCQGPEKLLNISYMFIRLARRFPVLLINPIPLFLSPARPTRSHILFQVLHAV